MPLPLDIAKTHVLVSSRSFLGLRSGSVVWLSGARLGGARLLSADAVFAGVMHERSMGEAPLIGELSRDTVVELLHRFKVRVVDETVVSNAWQINSAASVDAEVEESKSPKSETCL